MHLLNAQLIHVMSAGGRLRTVGVAYASAVEL
jgi:hypothetical protein